VADLTLAGETPARRASASVVRRQEPPPPEPAQRDVPAHRAILVVDIAEFARADRDDEIRRMLRYALYRLLESAFDDAGIGWRACAHIDRGDAVLIIGPPSVSPAVLVEPLLTLLRAGLALYNRYASVAARLRLRAALHAGPVCSDAYGVTGTAVHHTVELAGSAPVRAALRDSAADLAFIASDRMFDDIIRHGFGAIDPAAYRPVPAGDDRGWLTLPAHGRPPYDGDPGVTVPPGGPSDPAAHGGGAVLGFFGNVTFGGDAVAGDKIVYM
jgi:hypothetical protein